MVDSVESGKFYGKTVRFFVRDGKLEMTVTYLLYFKWHNGQVGKACITSLLHFIWTMAADF